MLPRPTRFALLASLGLWLGFSVAKADVSLAPPFTSHMVLQRGREIVLKGRADPGESVRVAFAGGELRTKADGAGLWSVRLTPMQASSESRVLVVRGKNEVRLEDVLVGDVWVASGQSNMAFMVRETPSIEDQVLKKALPMVRTLRVLRKGASEPKENLLIDPQWGDSWQLAEGRLLQDFSVVAAVFADRINRETGVPVGVIQSAIGGTRIEPWISPAGWAAIPEAGKSRAITGGYEISGLYNAMIHPLTGFPIKGAIWYQGESSAPWALRYADQFKGLITGWRKAWGQGDFPFLFVQIAPFRPVDGDVTNQSWAWLREAQDKTLKLPATGMVVTTDLGEFSNIHPRNKVPVGERLAGLALQMDGLRKHAESPRFEKMKIKDGTAVLCFSHIGEGLGPRKVVLNRERGFLPGEDPQAAVAPADKLVGFTIAGKDRNFVPADAKIVGKGKNAYVVVSSGEVLEPVAVRYGWEDFPVCNLYGVNGQPVSPFKTDDFPAPDFLGRKIGELLTNKTEPAPANAIEIATATSESSAHAVTVHGRQGYRTDKSDKYNGRYVYAGLSKSDLKNGASPKVTITVVYFDEGPETIEVVYDSLDESYVRSTRNPGAWKPAGKIRLDQTKTWRVVSLKVDDARFASRQNGWDIRLQWPENIDGVFGGVWVCSDSRKEEK